jgi:hypothetical protein
MYNFNPNLDTATLVDRRRPLTAADVMYFFIKNNLFITIPKINTTKTILNLIRLILGTQNERNITRRGKLGDAHDRTNYLPSG